MVIHAYQMVASSVGVILTRGVNWHQLKVWLDCFLQQTNNERPWRG